MMFWENLQFKHRSCARAVLRIGSTAMFAAMASTAWSQQPNPPATAVPALATTAPDFVFDRGKYVYLSVRLQAEDKTIFDKACPDNGNLLGIDFADIVAGNGKREAKVTVEITLPPIGGQAATVKLDPVTIAITPGMFIFNSRKCEVALEAFDYSSPLFFMGAFEGQNFNVRTGLYKRREGAGAIFADTLDGAIAVVNSFSVVPAEAALKIGEIGKLARKAGAIESKVSSGIDLKVAGTADQPVYSKDWPLLSENTGLPMTIVVRAQLRARDTLIHRQGAQWTPADVMQTPFPARGNGGNLRSYLMDANVAGDDLSQFENSSTLETAKVACLGLFAEVNRIGLSAADRALLKWALVRGHPSLASNPAMDHMACMDGVFALLPPANSQGTAVPAEFGKRALFPDGPKMRPANHIEIESTIMGEERLAVFFKSAGWNDARRRIAQRMFASPHEIRDTGSIELINSAAATLGPNEWASYQWDSNRAMATKIGCYTYAINSSDVPPGTMYAIGQFVSGQNGSANKDALMRLTFAELPEGTAGEAKISLIELIAQPDTAVIAAVKARHRACGSGDWVPDFLK